MGEPWRPVQRTFLLLTLSSTLASSFIWGINTLFLLDAGLNNAEAFAANAFFTAGEVIFEVPTGVVADTWGRRASYLLGSATLLISTLIYVAMWKVHAPFWGWAVASILLGLGFTFFSGATEAWLVDALAFGGYKGKLETVLSKGQAVTGAAMLVGSIGGGLIAQVTNLGVPYVIRSLLLVLTMGAAWLWMKDLGFTPVHGKGPMTEVRKVLRASIDSGWRNAPVRWLMLGALVSGGVGIYAFYALQPYLLLLHGDPHAYGIAGLAAAIIAGTQILGGLAGPILRRFFSRRTHVLIFAAMASAACLAGIAHVSRLGPAIGVLVIWGMAFAIAMPVRQAYLNGLVPSAQRATVLSSYNLMESAGGVIAQPALGRVADVYGYPAAYVVCAVVEMASIPFLLLARRERAASDPMDETRGQDTKSMKAPPA
jgi:MFS family permease